MSIPYIFPGILDEIKTPWRWYTDQFRRNYNRIACKKDECGDCQYGIPTPANQMLPFQVIRDYTNDPILWIKVYKINKDNTTTLAYTFNNPTFVFNYQVDDKEYIQYLGVQHGILMDPGKYEAEMYDGTNHWYSEVFEVLCHDLSINLVVNGDFSDGFNAWDHDEDHGVQTVNGGQICIDATGVAPIHYRQYGIFEADKYYKITVNVVAFTPPLPILFQQGDTGPQFAITSVGLKTVYIQAQAVANPDMLHWIIPTNGKLCIDYIHVQEIIPANTKCNIMLEWWNDCGYIGNLYFDESYINRFFVDAKFEVAESRPKLVKEAHENGDKQQLDQWIRRDTEYTLNIGMVPRYLLEALFEMQLHTNIQVTIPSSMGGGKAMLRTVEVSYSWEEAFNGCLANVNIAFTLDDSAEKEGCCEDTIPDPCQGGNLPELQLQCNTSSPFCTVCRGSTISFLAANVASGQASGNTYEWSGPNGFTSALQNPDISGADPVNAGEYTCTVTNSLGCTDTDTITVNVVDVPEIEVVAFESPSGGGGNGSIQVNATGGTAPYLYTIVGDLGWSDVNIDGNFTGLDADHYVITVTDDNGCENSIDQTI